MIKPEANHIIHGREKIFASACGTLCDELKTIEPTIYDVFIRLGQLPGVYDEVTAILGRHFKYNSMTFACTGDCVISWDQAPVIALDLEFLYDGIFAFFRLTLTAVSNSVELHHISFENSSGAGETNTAQLSEAIKRVKIN